MATLVVWATDRHGEEFAWDERSVEPGTWATDDFRFDLEREALEAGMTDVWSEIVYDD